MAVDKSKPSPLEVDKFHTNADTDGGSKKIHHTLGPAVGQAAPGNHTHSGGDSAQLMDGITIAGSKGGNVAVASLITELSKVLGFTDATT